MDPPYAEVSHSPGRPVAALNMAPPRTYGEVVAIIERHVDEALQRVLRSTTDPARGLPRFKKKAEQALDERVLNVLLAVLAEVHVDTLTPERLRADSYERIEGQRLEAEDKLLRRRLQGIPETAPSID
jgi:hypothetical protein